MNFESHNMESLGNDLEYYEKCFENYLKISNRYVNWLQWIVTVFDENLLPKLKPNGRKDSSPLKMLGIGCSDGTIDYDFVRRWSAYYPKIFNRALEPGDAIENYQQIVTDKPITGATWKFHHQSWEEFCSEVPPGSEKFHFINAISVLYYMEDWRREVMNMYEYLEDGGLLLIVVTADHNRSWKLPEQFPELTDHPAEKVNSKTVEEFLKTESVNFKTVMLRTVVDISSIFEDGSADGKKLLDFLTHVKDFEQTASPEMVSKFKKYLKNGDCTYRESGRILLDNSCGALIIEKSTPK
ncbi:histamine N-methyltransferase-like isoform X2 [Apostichopus japonicus]